MGIFNADSSDVRFKRGKNTAWFWRGVFVAVVAHSWMAAGDLKLERQPVWSESAEVVELADVPLTELRDPVVEFELEDNSSSSELENQVRLTDLVAAEDSPVDEPPATLPSRVPDAEVAQSAPEAQLKGRVADTTQPLVGAQPLSDIPVEFPDDVPMSEVLRVSRTFQGLIQENLKGGPYVLSERFAGSLTSEDSLEEIDTEAIDGSAVELGFMVGQDVDESVESEGLDPFKTYTVVDGRIRAVTPSKVVSRPVLLDSGAIDASAADSRGLEAKSGSSGADIQPTESARLNSDAQMNSPSSGPAISLTREEIESGLAETSAQSEVASFDSSSVVAKFVTVAGTVRVPEGFARDKVVLRLAGTGFQVQTDAAGQFELRDVPKGTRFELLVWHLDGGLTRRLVPVSASGSDDTVEIELAKTSYVDALAKSFGLVQQMNLGGFCAKVEVENPTALLGANIFANTVRKNLTVHYFSEQGFPVANLSELTQDGRFCVFNVEDALVDVRLVTLTGVRRQFVVHTEPSTFEHDLIFDASKSFYRRVSLLEPLDTREVIELSGQGIQPDFGDKRLRNWIFGEDTPVWTRVSNYVLRADEAYAPVRPKAEDLQFLPGGQKFIEVKVAPDIPDAPWGRILISRDDLMTESMLNQLESRVYQDKKESVSLAALDADAWDEIVASYDDIPAISNSEFGGLYISIDAAALGQMTDDLSVFVRDTWTGESVCELQKMNTSASVKSSRYFRAVCGAKSGQFALIVQSRDGALLWSDVVRIRRGTVQTVTVMDPNF